MTADELEKYLKLIALVQQGFNALLPFLARLKSQGLETTEQILDHAEKANNEAKAIIDSL